MRGSPSPSGSVFGLLTRLFVRRFLEQESLSPHADRLRTLAVVYGLVLTLGVFYTFFLCIDYLSALVQLPGPAALRAVSDRFMYIAASLAATALATLAVWDALALEPRDAAILGPLPIPANSITRAKLTAAGLFTGAVILLLNAGPAVLYPALLTLNIRGVDGSTLLALIAAHASTVALAGLFGFVSILAVRGLTRVLLGERTFGRVSAAVHSVLVVVTFVALLLVPTVRSATVRAWIAQGPVAPVRPVLWFLGVHEATVGRLLADTPVVLPPRLTAYPVADNASGRAEYLALLPALRALAQPVWWGLPLMALVGGGTFLWANRRLPEPARDTVPGRSRVVHGIIRHTRAMDPERQAGLHFTWQVLARSRPHRLLLAISVAIGATHAVLVVLRGGLVQSGDTPAPGAFTIALLLLGAVLVGARHALTVPATPAANWVFHTAWRGDDRPYLAGVKWGVLTVAGGLIVVLLPAHVMMMGTWTAAAHSVIAWLFARALLDALLLAYRQLPFACSYLPLDNPKVVWPVGVCGLVGLSYLGAAAEQWAAASLFRWLELAMLLGILSAGLKWVDGIGRRVRRPVNFNDSPAPATQRLGLQNHLFESG